MKIGAADIGCRQLYDDVGEFLELGIGYFVDRYLFGAVVNERFHYIT